MALGAGEEGITGRGLLFNFGCPGLPWALLGAVSGVYSRWGALPAVAASVVGTGSVGAWSSGVVVHGLGASEHVGSSRNGDWSVSSMAGGFLNTGPPESLAEML